MSKSMMILIAGPYRSGTEDDPTKMAVNLRNLEEAALLVFRAGHIPMIGEWVALPLMHVAGSAEVGGALYDEIVYPAAHRLLAHCHAVLRLPGASRGADMDVKIATERGLHIYYDFADVPPVSA